MRRYVVPGLSVVLFRCHELRGLPVVLNVTDANGPQTIPYHLVSRNGLPIILEDAFALPIVLHEAQGCLRLEGE